MGTRGDTIVHRHNKMAGHDNKAIIELLGSHVRKAARNRIRAGVGQSSSTVRIEASFRDHGGWYAFQDMATPALSPPPIPPRVVHYPHPHCTPALPHSVARFATLR